MEVPSNKSWPWLGVGKCGRPPWPPCKEPNTTSVAGCSCVTQILVSKRHRFLMMGLICLVGNTAKLYDFEAKDDLQTKKRDGRRVRTQDPLSKSFLSMWDFQIYLGGVAKPHRYTWMATLNIFLIDPGEVSLRYLGIAIWDPLSLVRGPWRQVPLHGRSVRGLTPQPEVGHQRHPLLPSPTRRGHRHEDGMAGEHFHCSSTLRLACVVKEGEQGKPDGDARDNSGQGWDKTMAEHEK